MNFTTLAISQTALHTCKPSNFLDQVENYEGKNGHFYARVTFKDIETKGYIYVAGNTKAIAHHCKNAEKGTSCTHTVILTAVAKEFGYDITHMSHKAKMGDFETFEANFNAVQWTDSSADIGIIPNMPSAAAQSTDENVQVASSNTTKREPAAGWAEIQEHLDAEGFSIALQNKIYDKRVAVHETIPMHSYLMPPIKPDTPYTGEMLEIAISHILMGENLILLGDAGTGKDTVINTISWIFGYPVNLVTGNKDESKESLIVEPAFINNESTYRLTNLTKACYEGGLINFAEINFLKGDVTSVFHPFFDDNGLISTPLGTFKMHPHTLFCASMNVGEGYEGVQRLNKAFKDRFCVLRLVKTASFKELISRKTGLVDIAALEFLEAIQDGLKELHVEGLATDTDTLRGYFKAAKYFLTFGYNQTSRIRAVEAYILNRVEELEEYCEARAAIREVFNELKLQDFPVATEEILFNPELAN